MSTTPPYWNMSCAAVDAVVNLIGILNERGDDGSGFREAHVELCRKLIAACRANDIRRLLHMSALNADARSGPSHYQRTKGEAEDLVHAAAGEDLRVTSFRPSVIFGPDDDFFNRFAGLLRFAPLVFPLACPNARFAPVYVGDVVEAMALSLTDPATYGRRYDLCGPKVYTLAELVAYTAQCLKLRRYVLPLNARLSLWQAQVLEHVPGKPLSLDNYRSLQIDSVCGGENGLLEPRHHAHGRRERGAGLPRRARPAGLVPEAESTRPTPVRARCR